MSTLPIPQDLIAAQNAPLAGALGDDYAALGRQLQRRGTSIDDIKARVAAFSVAIPTWGSGRGGTRFLGVDIAHRDQFDIVDLVPGVQMVLREEAAAEHGKAQWRALVAHRATGRAGSRIHSLHEPM